MNKDKKAHNKSNETPTLSFLGDIIRTDSSTKYFELFKEKRLKYLNYNEDFTNIPYESYFNSYMK